MHWYQLVRYLVLKRVKLVRRLVWKWIQRKLSICWWRYQKVRQEH